MRHAVVTGVSKGLGESIAKLLMESGINVVGVSRSSQDKLADIALENNVDYKHYACDLGDLEETEQTFSQISEEIFSREPETVYLINNAAVLEPVDKSMNTESADVAHHMQVNTIAPMILTNLFLKNAVEKDIRFIGTTISSGAAERPMYGWSAYCTSKAGINMFTQTAALEQEELNTQNKVIAFSPGIMDTEMQERIRASDEDAFRDVEQFRAYKENNKLKSTDAIGGILIDILTDETSVENGKIYHASDYF
ncbi:(S)-benzoin forming benzil reductase [Lentibacillus amyloliquefaciens]|uniref:Short-chain dehydrogenase n=1 Tax=Lentibacillus amyloliquefaciens TaxID=1472767 RepID=A0A0U4E625_9BACI|nr:(S)-benzoin forming benzil reductase [Lentibacillus amyloliquefaciens]ALX48732.1 short-chain dehydrogenase [Lentibacillus amyloliquefaciens]